jgi:stearoyl-CoA desaturase (delta-9 desaturase)
MTAQAAQAAQSGSEPELYPIPPAEHRWIAARIILVNAIPFLGFIYGLYLLARVGISMIDLALLCVFYAINIVGVEIGFHRFFAHRSFEAGPFVRGALALFGTIGFQGTATYWAAVHRRHHQLSDISGDPHTPNRYPGLRGLLSAHMGWFLDPVLISTRRYAPEIREDKAVRRISKGYIWYAMSGIIVPAAIGGLATFSLTGAWTALVWGGLVRIFLAQHATYLLNSVCHSIGTRAFATDDRSRNNAFVALVTFGGGWHNNHHAFPGSARAGFRWWEVDAGWWLIRLLASAGLVWNVKEPAPEAVNGRRV